MELELSDKAPDVVTDSFVVATNEDWFRNYQLKNDGVPIRIEDGWRFYMQLQAQSSGDIALSASSDNARMIVVDHDGGVFGLRVKQADASQIAPTTYSYDIILVAGEGIYRLAKGIITVERGITNVPGQEKWTHFPLIQRP